MATVRLANGGDVTVKLEVAETIAAITKAGAKDFVELPGEDGPIHVRPSGIIAVLDDTRRGTAGFRVGHHHAGSR